MTERLIEREIRHAHFFCGLGGGARGFNMGRARVGNMVAKYRCIGGIDVDPASVRDFERLAGVKGTAIDLFSYDQYVAFHGKAPPPTWREATVEDIHRAFGFERPHIVFLSAPCKGFSGLLGEKQSKTDKYQALNGLTLRGMMLMMEAWRDDPPELVIFENVPRIATRGRYLMDQIMGLMRGYGYAGAETDHNCGEIADPPLAQSRERHLVPFRHTGKVPAFLYEPPKRALRGVGEVLDRMPLPGDVVRGGPMHRVPALQWKTWVRLAFVPAGKDWRALNDLRVEDGVLTDFAIAPATDWQGGVLGVTAWDEEAGVVQSASRPSNGNFSVADPRLEDKPRYSNVCRVIAPEETAPAVTSAKGSLAAVADPRIGDSAYNVTKYQVTPYDGASRAVIGASTAGDGAYAVADPRPTHGPNAHTNKLKVVDYEHEAPVVTGSDRVGSGALSVADPRPNMDPNRESYRTQGHYGVLGWEQHSWSVTGYGQADNGRWSIADRRVDLLPGLAEQLVCIIIARDGTWHRPFTTLELAALQSLYDPEDFLELDGRSDSAWRERIGNAVPSAAAKGMADVFGDCLLRAWAGESFKLSNDTIWVRKLQIALSVDLSGQVPA